MELPTPQLVPLVELHTNPNNPRVLRDESFKKLCASLKGFPEMMRLRPIIADANGMILGGNQRFEAAKELGWQEVPVIWASELTEAQKQEFIIRDNVQFGEWDWECLSNEWDADMLEEWGLAGVFTMDAASADYPEIPGGERSTFATINFTFTLAQKEEIETKIEEMKKEMKLSGIEIDGNLNGHALYLIVSKWEKQN
jgi:ParB-like chromosome segregation protein Spo0J